uniref:Uncharacterized protein n=1 Tax=Arundo donax TaxID=35708 RepID=A0A0A9ER31_ARUDO
MPKSYIVCYLVLPSCTSPTCNRYSCKFDSIEIVVLFSLSNCGHPECTLLSCLWL